MHENVFYPYITWSCILFLLLLLMMMMMILTLTRNLTYEEKVRVKVKQVKLIWLKLVRWYHVRCFCVMCRIEFKVKHELIFCVFHSKQAITSKACMLLLTVGETRCRGRLLSSSMEHYIVVAFCNQVEALFSPPRVAETSQSLSATVYTLWQDELQPVTCQIC